MILPRKDASGNPITYREYDIHPYTPGVNRGPERIVIGGGRRYYTSDHYRSFTAF
jgi:guanyl-specific ribonuclease Sa